MSIASHQFSFQYAEQAINFHIWSHDTDKQVTVVVFLGTVQIGILPRWVIEQCPPGTLVVEGAPHWHAAADGSDILAYMDAYTKRAYQAIENKWHPGNVRFIADSQATPGLLRLLAERPDLDPGYVVLLQPLGLNSASFGSSQAQRVREFRRRIGHNLRFQIGSLLTDSRLRYNHRLVGTKVNIWSAKAKAQYAGGLAYDSLGDLQRVAVRLDNLVIICGANDKLFPADEIRRNLQTGNIAVPVEEVPGVPHSPLPTRLGRRLLAAALDHNRL